MATQKSYRTIRGKGRIMIKLVHLIFTVVIALSIMLPTQVQAGDTPIRVVTDEEMIQLCYEHGITGGPYTYVIIVEHPTFSSLDAVRWYCEGGPDVVIKRNIDIFCQYVPYALGRAVPIYKGALWWKKVIGWGCAVTQ